MYPQDIEARLAALELRIRVLETRAEDKTRHVPDSERLDFVCQKFGISLKALPGPGISSHLVVARNAVVRELFMTYGWPIEKLMLVTKRSRRTIERMLNARS